MKKIILCLLIMICFTGCNNKLYGNTTSITNNLLYSLENNKKLVGKTVPVLVEGKNTNGKDGLYGYTDTNKLINFNGDESLTGKIILVKVTDAKTWSLDGEIDE